MYVVCVFVVMTRSGPRVVDERIGDVSEEDVFADAVCEFSSSLVSDSIKGKEETEANGMAKNATDLGEFTFFDKQLRDDATFE